MTTKATFRARLKALRDGLALADREAWSATICQHLEAFLGNQGSTRVAAFWPYGSEVDLRSTFGRMTTIAWYFPRIASLHPPTLTWGQAPLAPGKWGLQEPVQAPHAFPPVDLLLVPGLAFDARGFRIGYGGGFYDALLSGAPARCLTLGIGFELQLQQPVPIEPHDHPVQALLTEAGLQWLRTPQAG